MAILIGKKHSVEIIPTSHFYVDYSDTNEFYYEIIIRRNKKKLAMPLGFQGTMIDSLSVETTDEMISQCCFKSIYSKENNYITDLSNGGFDLDLKLSKENKWKIRLEFSSHYFDNKNTFVLGLTISEKNLFEFSKTLRYEEAQVLSHLLTVDS